MRSLILHSQPSLYLSQSSPWKPKSSTLHLTSPQNLPLPKRTYHIQPNANAKGFGNSTPATMKEKPTSKNPKNDDDDEIPQVVQERMLVRIGAAVVLPLATGIAILKVFEYIKENQLWDVPVWLPFLTTLLTFGTSALGIAFGALSTSWDAERRARFLVLKKFRRIGSICGGRKMRVVHRRCNF